GPGEEKYFVLEFPFYQAVVAVLYRIFGLHPLWGRVLSVVMGYLGAVFLFLLVRLISEDLHLAWASIFIYLGIPINLHFNRTFIMDPMVVALIIIFLYCFARSILSGKLTFWLAGLVAASLSFVHKGVYGPFFLLPVVFLCLAHRREKKNCWLALMSLALPLAVLFRWYLHTAGVNLATGHGDHTLGDQAYRIWNFGLWKDRFSWKMWQPRLINLYPEFITPVTIIPTAVGLFSLHQIKNSRFFLMLLVASAVYFLTIFRLQDCHYYQLVITPIAAILCGHGLLKITRLFPDGKKKGWFLVAFNFVFLITSLPLAYRYRKFQPEVLEIAGQVRNLTRSDEAVIFCFPEYDWNSQYVYYADRKGIALASADLTPGRLRSLRRKGFGLLVLLDWQKYFQQNGKQPFLKNLELQVEKPAYRIYRLKNG
ncbi:MAG TPA: glycosyltransferase family 39 protein, partial [bacterium]|nr:glycosyltransferase family 39 protein [bacterium]